MDTDSKSLDKAIPVHSTLPAKTRAFQVAHPKYYPRHSGSALLYDPMFEVTDEYLDYLYYTTPMPPEIRIHKEHFFSFDSEQDVLVFNPDTQRLGKEPKRNVVRHPQDYIEVSTPGFSHKICLTFEARSGLLAHLGDYSLTFGTPAWRARKRGEVTKVYVLGDEKGLGLYPVGNPPYCMKPRWIPEQPERLEPFSALLNSRSA